MQKKNKFDIDKTNIKNKVTNILSDLSYKHYTAEVEGKPKGKIKSLKKLVCILPFELSSDETIKNVYLSREYDIFSDKTYNSIIKAEYNDVEDDSNLDAVLRYLNINMNVIIDDSELDRIFYLGDLEFNSPFEANIPCYGVKVDGLIKKKDEFFDVSEFCYVHRKSYSDVLKNGNQDVMVLSSLMMLLTYYTA